MNLNAVITPVDKTKQVGHKDLFLTQGVKTTAGAKVLHNFIPPYSATVVIRLEHQDLDTAAKLNCDAWAHGSSGENSDFGPALNPWNPDYTPGGSSSGSAAAVAAGLVEFATGTDTGGSIRLPASFCGVTGLKPTYGAVSRYGIIAMASSLDCPGLLTRDVSTCRRLFPLIAGKDELDAISQDPPITYPSKTKLKIGLPKEYFISGIDPQVNQAVKQAAQALASQGHRLVDISLPHTQYSVAVYYLIQTAEVASNLARYDGIRYGRTREHFGAEAKRRIMLGTFALSAGYQDKYYEQAARVRTLIIQDFDRAFRQVDVILAPVSPTPPFKLGEKIADPLTMYLSDILTIPANLAGIPALAFPCGFTPGNLPIGLQLMGPRWSEEILFNLGETYQSLTNWHLQKPKL